MQYEGFKRDYLDTASLCRAEGMLFIPMVMEASGGGWGEDATKTWNELAKTSALASGELRSSVLGQVLGSLSITLHKENARAVLRRIPRRQANELSSAGALLACAVADADP